MRLSDGLKFVFLEVIERLEVNLYTSKYIFVDGEIFLSDFSALPYL